MFEREQTNPVPDKKISRRDFNNFLLKSFWGLTISPLVRTVDSRQNLEDSRQLKYILPAHITVPSVNLNYQLVSKAQLQEGTWTAPETGGIATPIENPPFLANTTYIFGHSNFRGIPGQFSILGETAIGDFITIDDGVNRMVDGYVQNLNYQVQEGGLIIADMEESAKIIFSLRQRTPRIILQTSLKPYGEGASFLMDFNKLQRKATVHTKKDLNDPQSYLLLLVVGELQNTA